ncbi:MAG: hypothetical protein AB8G05_01405 [Oligoflexales bacterium]
MVSGMCERTGKLIKGREFLSQSIRRVLLTPKRSMLGMRDFGSDFLVYLDQPQNAETLLDISSEVSIALESQIKGLKLINVSLKSLEKNGEMNLIAKVSDGLEEWTERI